MSKDTDETCQDRFQDHVYLYLKFIIFYRFYMRNERMEKSNIFIGIYLKIHTRIKTNF